MSNLRFILYAVLVAICGLVAFRLLAGEYFAFAGYIVLQYVVLATAWNILGGYCGYVNFGTAGFFAVGAYVSVALHRLPNYLGDNISQIPQGFVEYLLPLPMPVLILLSGLVSGLIGLAMGYLTLRLKGVFFAIATLALAVVLQTLVINSDYLGGSRGVNILRPHVTAIGGVPYEQYLFGTMLCLAVFAVVVARVIEKSKLGVGMATIRDDELAAESCGVPTLRVKLVATAISGALMGMAGAPFPYYVGYIEPQSTFSLIYAVNAIAIPMIGGTTGWLGPIIGAVLIGGLQQIASVTISSAASLLLVGCILVLFVVIAPNGILGWLEPLSRRSKDLSGRFKR